MSDQPRITKTADGTYAIFSGRSGQRIGTVVPLATGGFEARRGTVLVYGPAPTVERAARALADRFPLD